MNEVHLKNISTKKKATILLAEERKLVREAWNFILNNVPHFQVIGECSSPESALLHAKKIQPDIIILEIKPPELSGIELVSLINKFSPNSKILAVSLYTIPNVAVKLMEAGVSGYITKTSPLQEILEAINIIKDGQNYVCREVKKIRTENVQDCDDLKMRLRKFSIRETEVVLGIRNGLASREIGEQLKISETTVEMHRYHILKKLKLDNASELIDFLTSDHIQV